MSFDTFRNIHFVTLTFPHTRQSLMFTNGLGTVHVIDGYSNQALVQLLVYFGDLSHPTTSVKQSENVIPNNKVVLPLSFINTPLLPNIIVLFHIFHCSPAIYRKV